MRIIFFQCFLKLSILIGLFAVLVHNFCLLQLFHLGMLKDYDIEDVIDKAVSKGSNQVTLEDVKAIAVSLIFESEMGNGKNFFYQSGTNSLH